MADKETLRKLISEILDGADLETVTAKKVRQDLEKKLDSDLTDRKKEIDQLVMEVLDEKNEVKSEEEDEESEEEKKPLRKKPTPKRKAAKNSDSEEEDDDDEFKPSGKKSKGKKADSDDDSDGDWRGRKARPRAKAAPKKKAAGGGGGAKKAGTGYTKTCTLSPALSAVMGEESMARHEVVKRMWAIIKEKNLYDPKNKQFALCNEELLPVFGVKRFRTFGMMKYLKNHFTD